MNRRANTIVMATLPLLLAGCVVLPVYKAAPDEAMVEVSVARLPSPSFCLDGKGYKPATTATGILLPADRLLTLHSSFYSSDGYVSHYCNVGADVRLSPDRRYAAAMRLSSHGCGIDFVRLDDRTPTGVATEDAVFAASCNPYNPSGGAGVQPQQQQGLKAPVK